MQIILSDLLFLQIYLFNNKFLKLIKFFKKHKIFNLLNMGGIELVSDDKDYLRSIRKSSSIETIASIVNQMVGSTMLVLPLLFP
jgi:hypothetical protein